MLCYTQSTKGGARVSPDLYTILSLAARYLFCGLMVLIVFRAWRITVVDNRRARILRAWTPETGCIGEFLVNPGKGKKRASVTIPREGLLGSGASADVRLKHDDLRKKHAYFEQREGGLLLKPLRGARVEFHGGISGDQLLLRDGDVIAIGKLKLMLVLFDSAGQAEEARPPRAPARPRPQAAYDDGGADGFVDEFYEEDDLWPEETPRGEDRKKR